QRVWTAASTPSSPHVHSGEAQHDVGRTSPTSKLHFGTRSARFMPTAAPREDAIPMTTPLFSNASLRYSLLTALLFLSPCPLFAKSKDDVVVMKNGDKFTGEIKNLQYGELVFKSSYMKDSVHLDWKEVESLQSKDTFIVSLRDGQRVTGSNSREGT